MSAARQHLTAQQVKRPTLVALLGADARFAENEGDLTPADLAAIDAEFGIAAAHPICDECETVAHCSVHGCIPKVPA